MFTGIVEELGTVRRISHHDGGARVEFGSQRVLEDAEIGASISVNGCCLTVVEIGPGWWAADAVTETLDRTCLGSLRDGDLVNLERPVRLADRLGGHLVQGHVDAVGTIVDKQPMADGSVSVVVAASRAVLRYVVEKGSITVDGVSLTVASLTGDGFAIAVVPHTLAVTTLGIKGSNDPVNLEVDVVAKYVERLMAPAACLNEEPAACLNEEPAACLNEEPAACLNEEPEES